MLGDAGDDVVALLFVELDHALDSQVVGFGRTAGEDDVLRRGANQRRNLVARLIHGLFRLPAEAMVAAGGIAELLSEIREHRFEHARIDARRRVIVHVNRGLKHLYLTANRWAIDSIIIVDLLGIV